MDYTVTVYINYLIHNINNKMSLQFINLLKIVNNMKLVKELEHKAFLFLIRECCMLTANSDI